MSLDKSLRSKSALERHRNVLSRAERIEKLKDEGKWTDESQPYALPKVAHRKTSAGAKDKKEVKTDVDKEAEAGTAETEEKKE